MIEIKNWLGVVLVSGDEDSLSALLSRATKEGAVLRGADLVGADLKGADLRGADLRGADLVSVVLVSANLRGANLRGADLTGANLIIVRDDLWAVLSSAPAEVPALIAALKAGLVDGSSYSGECACLVGTIANARHCNYNAIPGLTPNSSRPAERFFLGIRQGDTPETSQASKLACEWAEDWLARMHAAFSHVAAS
jgi:hypothetical protein